MCGRFALTHEFKNMESLPGISFQGFHSRFNIAPTSSIPVVRETGEKLYRLDDMRWGLVPHWSKEPSTKFSTFNARAETAASKPAFRDSFKQRRCLIPASGFYEWKTVGAKKHPYYFTDKEGKGLLFAGLWDYWRQADQELFSCTILVCPPNKLIEPVHNRMPVILNEEDYKTWLHTEVPKEELQALLQPFPAEAMQCWPVSSSVGNTRNESPSLIDPI